MSSAVVPAGGSQSESTLAILIDAENSPHDLIGQVLTSCASFGRAIIIRAYGDWTVPSLSPWREVFKEYPINAVQQFHNVSGKNASDSAMNIDAMDIVHDKRVDTFVLVTSDSDFTRLAIRAREEGLQVIGFGRKTTPRSFVSGCNQFLYLENLPPIKPEGGPAPPVGPDGEEAQLPEAGPIDETVLLTKAAHAWQQEDDIISGAQLGNLLRRLDPAFHPRNYGYEKLADLVAKHPEILKPTGKRKGLLDPEYKFEKPTTSS